MITLLGEDVAGAADRDTITLTVNFLPPTVDLDLQAASDTGRYNWDNVTRAHHAGLRRDGE